MKRAISLWRSTDTDSWLILWLFHLAFILRTARSIYLRFNFLPSVKEKLLAEHKAAWKALWDTGRMEIEGDLEMAQAVYGSMYYILSSTRHDWPYGLSPGGLPGGEEYMGHTFWDQDIWMYPPLVLLHPDLARSSLRYRKNRLPAARRIAKEYGYRGRKVTYHVTVLPIHRITKLTELFLDQ